MLAGGLVESGAGQPLALSAYVAVSLGRESRLFKIAGSLPKPSVVELPSATTVDLGRFQEELREDLRPALERVRVGQGVAAITAPSSKWVCGILREHLVASEGVDPGT